MTFWCGFSKLGTVGPYIFLNETEQVDTVNSQRYVNMIEEFTIPQLQQYNYNMEEYYSEGEYYYPNLLPSLILQTRKGAFSLVLTSLTTQQDNLLFQIFDWMMQ